MLALTPSTVATIVEVPYAMPVTMPDASIVAIAGLELVHAVGRPSTTVPRADFAIAASARVRPRMISAGLGVSVTVVTIGSTTVTGASANFVGSKTDTTRIVAVPGPTPVTSASASAPLPVTVTIAGLDDCHWTRVDAPST